MQEQVRQIITIYCLCDDFLRAWGYKDAPQAKMTTVQVMTVSLVAVTLFSGNQERSRCFLKEHGYKEHGYKVHGYIKNMVSKGNFNRRLHEVPEAVWQALFQVLSDVHKQMNKNQQYAVDSLPVPVCDNIRIQRSRLYPCPKKAPVQKEQSSQSGRHSKTDKTKTDKTKTDKTKNKPEGFRGYIASKKRYFQEALLSRSVTFKKRYFQEALLLWPQGTSAGDDHRLAWRSHVGSRLCGRHQCFHRLCGRHQCFQGAAA